MTRTWIHFQTNQNEEQWSGIIDKLKAEAMVRDDPDPIAIADAMIEEQVLDDREDEENLCTHCGFHYPCKCYADEVGNGGGAV